MRGLLRVALAIAAATAQAQAGAGTGSPDYTASTAPLPPMHDLLERADRVDQASTQALPMYEWVQVERIEGDHNGKSEAAETECRFGYSVERVGLTRLLIKNGTARSAGEIAEADREAQGIVRNGVKHTTSPTVRHSLDVPNVALERIGVFQNPHRIVYRGRPSIVVTYEGDPNRKASGLAEKQVRATRGTLIFDEAEGALVSSDLTMVRGVTAMMFAGVKKGARMVIVNTRTAEGVWVPLLVSFGGQGHLFFNAISVNSETRYADYVFTGTHPQDIYAGKTLDSYPAHVRNSMQALLQQVNGTADDDETGTEPPEQADGLPR